MKTGVLPDIHSYENRLRLCVSRIENGSFSSEDKLLIKNYLKHVEAQGVSKGRVFKIAWPLTWRRIEKARQILRGISRLLDWQLKL